jgi:glutamate racemase
MTFDLVAGTKRARRVLPDRALDAPRVLVFDSGLGGLTVYPAVVAAVPNGTFLFLADDAVFPYGDLSEAALVDRVTGVLGVAIRAFDPDAVVIACNTASTSVLPPLRAAWPDLDFVGTVPAVKPAAAQSRSKLISVLATPGTVAREYTRDLVRTYAEGCAVTLVGASQLARVAEIAMRGAPVDTALLRAEIAPAFVTHGADRTDTVVLACTHYPLLLPQLDAAAPWPVQWIDPAPAIARRVRQVLGTRLTEDKPAVGRHPAVFTSNREPGPELTAFLAARGLQWQSSTAFATLPRVGADA